MDRKKIMLENINVDRKKIMLENINMDGKKIILEKINMKNLEISRKKRLAVAVMCMALCITMLAGCGTANENKDKSGQTTKSESSTSESKDSSSESEDVSSQKEISESQREIFAMDTYMTIKTYGKQADAAAEAAVKEINRLDKMLSTGKSESEIAILNENGSEILSEETGTLVEKSCELYKSTRGAFNIAVYPLMKEWGFTNQKYKVPDEKTISSLLKNIDVSKIDYDKKTKKAVLPKNYKIDLGGIAKGYTSARVMDIFKKYKLDGGIVSLGGNVQTYGKKQDGSQWKVAIENPDTSPLDGDYLGVLEVNDMAVITSGSYERYFEKDGKRYHHILDPKTGRPANSGLISVSIISKDGTLADGLSTSLFIMGKEKGEAYWRKNRDKFDVVWLEENGSVTITDGISKIFTSDFKYDVVK